MPDEASRAWMLVARGMTAQLWRGSEPFGQGRQPDPVPIAERVADIERARALAEEHGAAVGGTRTVCERAHACMSWAAWNGVRRAERSRAEVSIQRMLDAALGPGVGGECAHHADRFEDDEAHEGAVGDRGDDAEDDEDRDEQ